MLSISKDGCEPPANVKGIFSVDSADDAFHSNSDFTVKGGDFEIATGGIFVATGSAGMAQNFGSSSTQGAMLVSIGSSSENSEITLENESAECLLDCTVEKTFDCVVISCPEIQQGEIYTVFVGEASEEVNMSNLIYGFGGMGKGKGGMGEKPDKNTNMENENISGGVGENSKE